MDRGSAGAWPLFIEAPRRVAEARSRVRFESDGAGVGSGRHSPPARFFSLLPGIGIG